MTRTLCMAALALVLVGYGCTEGIPTTSDQGRIPIEVETFEVRLPFSEFGGDLQAFSGFGSAAQLTTWPLMQDWSGSLDSRILFRSSAFPDSILVRPVGQNLLVGDSEYRPIRAEIFLRLDTLEALGADVFELEASEVVEPFHAFTASWDFAADTIGGRVSWSEPGGGALVPLDTRSWDPLAGDSLTFEVDSATTSAWQEQDDIAFLLAGNTSNSRVRVLGAQLFIDVRSTVNPDTVVVLTGGTIAQTFIYTPGVEAVDSVLQVGGVPGSRVSFTVDLPEFFDPGPDVCAQVECPIDADEYQLLYGSLVLETHPPVSPGLAPRDTVSIQVRESLSPERLPRSPLSASLHPPLAGIAPTSFNVSEAYEVPLTGYLRSLIQPDSTDPDPMPTLTILGDPEPDEDVYVSSFYGSGSEREPWFRLIFARSDQVSLP